MKIVMNRSLSLNILLKFDTFSHTTPLLIVKTILNAAEQHCLHYSMNLHFLLA